ncbi:hypothetical protein TNCV_1998061 [Trichonephila clavipes]|uniref:Uncharacterized protein n=1 Tax=Trichonephila clavipes TaxID=2585209 RepID=A0A8X6RQN9_TRICX|nr:hypothetical protein TNCV_1998061 [Trichonephila clavipes]
MQPDLRMHICEHIIRVLQYQKDVNQKQHICVKHDFVVSNHTITVNLHSGTTQWKILGSDNRWIPRGVSFQRPRHRLIAVASLGRLSRNRSIPVSFTRYPRTALSDRWRSLGITSLMNIGGIRYVHIHSYIGHHDQACVLACKIQCISKFHEIKLKS